MKGRTYRYFKGEPLYPFGFGLSYSTFEYSGLLAKRTAKGAEIRATVKNTSARDGDEVVQLYVGGGPEEEAPVRSLRGFQRIHLRAGESREVTFTLGSDETAEVRGGGQRRRRAAAGRHTARAGPAVDGIACWTGVGARPLNVSPGRSVAPGHQVAADSAGHPRAASPSRPSVLRDSGRGAAAARPHAIGLMNLGPFLQDSTGRLP